MSDPLSEPNLQLSDPVERQRFADAMEKAVDEYFGGGVVNVETFFEGLAIFVAEACITAATKGKYGPCTFARIFAHDVHSAIHERITRPEGTRLQ